MLNLSNLLYINKELRSLKRLFIDHRCICKGNWIYVATLIKKKIKLKNIWDNISVFGIFDFREHF